MMSIINSMNLGSLQSWTYEHSTFGCQFCFSTFLVKGVYSGWGASLAVNLETFSIRQVSQYYNFYFGHKMNVVFPIQRPPTLLSLSHFMPFDKKKKLSPWIQAPLALKIHC